MLLLLVLQSSSNGMFPRGAKINPQPWIQLNFSKPLVGKETRRDASLCLYDPTSLKRKDPECRKEIFKEFQEKFKKACPAAPVIHVKNDSSTSVKTNFREHQKGSPLSYHLPSIDSIGADQTNIYSELPIQLPVLSDGWSEYVHGFHNQSTSKSLKEVIYNKTSISHDIVSSFKQLE